MTKKVLVLFLTCFILLSGVAYSEDPGTTRLQDFAWQIYQDYTAESFASVYAAMHPSIKEQVTEEEYVEFQQRQFERLSLEITEVEVGEVSENPRLIRSLRQLLPSDEDRQIFDVEIRYRASFVSGITYNQRITKTAYIVALDFATPKETLYLLWDPSSMEEEEEVGNEGH